MKQTPTKNLQRAEVILQVQCGLLTATEAARKLGVSRKTYYEWEKKGLAALMEALQDGTGGRPPKPPDPALQTLRRENLQLQRQNQRLEQKLAIRTMIDQLDQNEAQAPLRSKSAKKNAASRRSSKRSKNS